MLKTKRQRPQKSAVELKLKRLNIDNAKLLLRRQHVRKLKNKNAPLRNNGDANERLLSSRNVLMTNNARESRKDSVKPKTAVAKVNYNASNFSRKRVAATPTANMSAAHSAKCLMCGSIPHPTIRTASLHISLIVGPSKYDRLRCKLDAHSDR